MEWFIYYKLYNRNFYGSGYKKGVITLWVKSETRLSDQFSQRRKQFL